MAPAKMWNNVFVILASTFLCTKGQDQNQCSIPQDWRLTWFYSYRPTNDLIRETFTDTKRNFDIDINTGVAQEESTCEQSFTWTDEEEDDRIVYNTIIAFKVTSIQDTQIRYCYDGIVRGDISIYHQSPQVPRTTGYTIQQCEDNLEGASSWNALIKLTSDGSKFTFIDTPSSFENPIDNGTYVFTYKNGAGTEQCGGTASTITVLDNTITTFAESSCFTGPITYVKPLNKPLKIIGFVTDNDLLDLSSFSAISGLMVLAYEDAAATLGYYFYIARFTLIEDETTGDERLQLLFTVNDRNKPTGYASEQFIPPDVKSNSDSIIYFYAKSTECQTKPCLNDGTCIQLWKAYLCNCKDGFSGDECEDDEDNCDLVTNPCNGRGTCKDAVNTFTCECNPGFGGDRCELLDPCNPNRCQQDAECYPLDDDIYFCDCPDGFLGIDCEFEDSCTADRCQNGGSCVLGPLGSTCICDVGFEGEFCEDTVSRPTGTPGGFGMVCRTDDHCENEGVCTPEGRCECPGFWSGALCQTVSLWFIVSIAMIVLLGVLLLVILIVCCCCCYGNVDQDGTEVTNNVYATMEAKSLDGMNGGGPMPGSVQFNVMPMNSATTNTVLTSSR